MFWLKQPDEIDFHPLNFKHSLKTQETNKTIMKILAMPNTKYELQDFHGGGKTTASICYRNKIVVPNKLQKSVISWYHTTLCHPGINRSEGRNHWTTFMAAKHERSHCKLCKDLPSTSTQHKKTKEIWFTPTKRSQSNTMG
jgi:hypothetical protein